MVQADKHSVNYETVLDSEQIESHLMTYNQKWFRQAEEAPFGCGELYEMMGSDGLTEEADASLNGTFVDSIGIPMSPDNSQLFSMNVDNQPTFARFVFIITVENYTDCFIVWKETTSTSPSARHLECYKAALHNEDLT